MRKVFAALAGRVRRLTSGLKDKPEVQIEDFELEHFLLYNGLIGSTPENQPQYKDVRNDMVQAINDASGHQLAIALKLPPLWWEDRLEKIFGEINEINRDGAIKCLLSERPLTDITGDTACLSHSDWRVRSNAARILAFLDAKHAVPRLIPLLDECQGDQKAAFCHIAYSLAKLGSEQARQALSAQLTQEEPWFGVDTTGSLAHWPLPSVSADLTRALLSGNIMDDYLAVCVAKRHRVVELAEYQDSEIQEGAAELVISLLKAIKGSFHNETHLHDQLEEAQPRINELAHQQPTPRRLAAAIALNKWVEDERDIARKPANQIRDISNKQHFASIKANFEKNKFETAAQVGDFKHALSLAAQFKLTELSPLLVPYIHTEAPALPELMHCIATLGDTSGASKITHVVEARVDLKKRCNQALDAHPSIEDDSKSSEIYWAALKALGSLPDKTSVALLSKAVNDHAPDKREQALLSLQTLLLSEDLRKNHYSGNLEELIRERTGDPAVSVQAAALAGVAQHKMTNLLPEVFKALHSREHSIQRRAADTLVSLANSGHRDSVKSAIETNLTKEHDAARRHRISNVRHRIQSLT